MASAVRSFRTFSVSFAVILVTFASTGTVLFGSSVDEFSSTPSSTKTCVNMLFNNFEISTIDEINYSVAFYWSYMTFMTFVLLNIVLAIVVDAYKEEKVKKDEQVLDISPSAESRDSTRIGTDTSRPGVLHLPKTQSPVFSRVLGEDSVARAARCAHG
ncbi:hypothetical protein PF011_g29557 [Phytophthora fragariae]|uniref:Polycystin cation channel PKD1/PKD2 domain-containing protein n=1 Tax=Phytophthora fragariae TaxID=53985 RepID=A0A6A3GY25_9STRA|nr:hypothetical protein PF011_g29557 [Phytophthora fragariae]